jgi:hypothetical protein
MTRVATTVSVDLPYPRLGTVFDSTLAPLGIAFEEEFTRLKPAIRRARNGVAVDDFKLGITPTKPIVCEPYR